MLWDRSVAIIKLYRSRRHGYPGSDTRHPRRIHDEQVLVLAVVLVFTVLLFEFRTFAAPISILCSARVCPASGGPNSAVARVPGLIGGNQRTGLFAGTVAVLLRNLS